METNILLPNPPKVIKKGENRAIFEIENCYPGYGMTLGNALRRVLLSSLPGAAIVGVKIKGVNHEFSTIPHVLEDVIQIILNLKQIRFKLYTDEPVKLTLKAKGEKEVKASDIKLTSDVEIVNKDAHIATLTDKKAELEMEIEVEKGLGYVPVEQRKKEKLSVGYIAVDAIFSPIKKVNYEIENMRVGDRTDFNRLKVDIETDGSITPEEAFQKAVNILVDCFKVLIEEERTEKKETSSAAKVKKSSDSKKKSKTVKKKQTKTQKTTKKK
ncbi:MAG: DNA-directed RNA polymerase subunit alpha [Thermoplasmata archaeon]|nr:MAG: DNA-directed RNA polymerase subunit alpha [Thermoplasmata archaeon]